MDRTRPYVLVVDDVPDAADILAMMLVLSGFDAAATYSGPPALASARARRPDAVIVDIGMFPMNGFEFTTQLRQLAGCERTVVVAFTGYTSAEHQAHGRAVGIDHYLFKPTDPVQLLTLLGRLTASARLPYTSKDAQRRLIPSRLASEANLVS